MKIIVFGGAGFIGSHIVDVLGDRKYDVTVFDIRKSPYLRAGQRMIVGDVLDQKQVEDAVRGHDVVYNLAGIADIDECARRPVDTVKYNVLGNVIILEASRKAGVKRFVFASSAYVYSESGMFYRSSKQSCELFIENYSQLYGLPYTILRYGSLYGERADERNSIYKLIKQALATGKIVYHGTGEELREYIHVQDAAQLSVDILKPEFENQHVVLTGTQSMPYKELLGMIREMLGSRVQIEYRPRKSETHYTITPYSFHPKLGRKLVNNPHIDMGQGLLSCMREIYHEIHEEQSEDFGLWIPKGEGEEEEDSRGA